MDLYDFPLLYDLLKSPSADDVSIVKNLVRAHVGAPLWSVADPACGPGNWLAPFAGEASRLYGNDFNERMVRFAREKLGDFAEVEHGDMYKLVLARGAFDVVLEASGVTSIVEGARKLGSWLRHLKPALSPRGCMLFLFHFDDPREQAGPPLELWRSNPLAIPGGGHCELTYTLVGWDRAASCQTIERRVRVRDTDRYPPEFVERYRMRIWSEAEIREALGLSDMRLSGLYDGDGRPSTSFVGERYLIFQ